MSKRFCGIIVVVAVGLVAVVCMAARAEDVKQPLPLPLRVSDLAVGDGAEVGSEPELVWLMVGSLLLATIMILRRKRWFV